MWYEGLGKLATAVETIKKMTFRQPAQKQKSRPLFPVPLDALVGHSYLILVDKPIFSCLMEQMIYPNVYFRYLTLDHVP